MKVLITTGALRRVPVLIWISSRATTLNTPPAVVWWKWGKRGITPIVWYYFVLHTKIFCQKSEVFFPLPTFIEPESRWDEDLLDKGDLALKAGTHACHKYPDMSQETTKIENVSWEEEPVVNWIGEKRAKALDAYSHPAQCRRVECWVILQEHSIQWLLVLVRNMREYG